MSTDDDDKVALVDSEVSAETSLPESKIQRSKCEKLTFYLRNITLEPCIFLLFVGLSMDTLSTQIILEKVCMGQYNNSICANLSNHNEEEIIVQQKANYFSLAYSIIRSIPTILFVLFLGPWSDKHGRKIPLMLPFIGSALSAGIMWVNAFFKTLPTIYILISVVPLALTGGITCFIMSVYSYISDISDFRSRTTRIAFIDTFITLGASCGLLLSKVTKQHIGYTGSYIMIGSLHVVAIIYIIVRIEETRGKNTQQTLETELVRNPTSKYRDIFNCNNIYQTFSITFAKRPNHGRVKVLLLMASICLLVFSFSSMGKEIYYTQFKFGWTYEDYIDWFIASILISFVGLVVTFPILSLKMGVRDELLGLLGSVSAITHYLITAFAVKGYQMYIASVCGIVQSIPLIVGRSMISKMISQDVTGKVFSVLASAESILPLLAAPAYTLTYNATINIFPGMIFIISAIAYSLCSLVYITLYCLQREQGSSPLVLTT